MTEAWLKRGQIFDPASRASHPKLLTHAANPLPIRIEGDTYRCFYSARDAQQRSSVGAVDIDFETRKVVREFNKPFFTHGNEDTFYSDGVSIGNCYVADGTQYMLFMGWHNPTDSHWRGEIGRLIVTPELELELESTTPLIGLNEQDPISLSYPWVHKNSETDFHMWFGSTKSWDAGNGEMLHTIEHATSVDGHNWIRNQDPIPSEIGVAQAFSRPTVLKTPGENYRMWFSYRCGTGRTYRIGHARSNDAMTWHLHLDETCIPTTSTGWDSEMVEYPFVFEHEQSTYMLYNGNSYGKTGFGLAELQSSS